MSVSVGFSQIGSINRYSLLSFKFPNPEELAAEPGAAPDFPAPLPPATVDPAAAAAAPGAPGGSANELVLGRPLPLIFFSKTVQGQGGKVYRLTGTGRSMTIWI